MKSLLKFGLVLIVFGLVMSGLTTMLIRANAVPETAVKKVSATANTPADSTQKPWNLNIVQKFRDGRWFLYVKVAFKCELVLRHILFKKSGQIMAIELNPNSWTTTIGVFLMTKNTDEFKCQSDAVCINSKSKLTWCRQKPTIAA